MLQVKNLSKSFSSTPILNDINFSLGLGEICAVVGNNGSGKTTFLRCLSGLMNFESGSINFNYLLIDEPFSNLDTDGIKIFKDIFNNFKSKNRSIIYSTHQNYQELNYDKIISIESFKGIK